MKDKHRTNSQRCPAPDEHPFNNCSEDAKWVDTQRIEVAGGINA